MWEISCLRARPKGFAIALWKPSPDHPCNYAVTTTKQQETTLQLTAAYWKGAVKSTCTKPNRGLILSQPSADSSLCGGSLLAALPAKPPLKGEVPATGGRRGSFPNATKVAAALSAAVTTTNLQEAAPNYQAEPPMQKQPRQAPAALRERGVWGERGFSQRSRLSPQNPPPPAVFSGGSAREGSFLQKRPLPRKTPPPPSKMKVLCGGLAKCEGVLYNG